MANLRIIEVKPIDSRTIGASFSEQLDPFIGIDNVIVESLVVGVPNAKVLGTKVIRNILHVTVSPLIPYVNYSVTFVSATVPFKSLNGNAYILNDGETNVKQILGPEEPENQIRNNLLSFLYDNIYDLSQGTIARLIINQLSADYLRATHDIHQAKNDNYLNVLVVDERHVRGFGPFDRLFQEGAYNVLRVGINPTNTILSGSFTYDSFPFDIITLQRTDVTNELLIAGNQDSPGTFNGFILSLDNTPVTKVNRIFIQYQDGYTFDYNINTFGYQLNNPRYDTAHASTFLELEDNQVQINSDVTSASGFIRVPGGGDKIYVDYEYKSLGRTIDDTSVAVSQILDAVREPTPPIINTFNLQHAPIVNSSGAIGGFGDVVFLDPHSATPFLTIHPAFTDEIPFGFGNVPSSPGEYSVNYETGQVFVYGATAAKDGTGNFPPAATYKYRSMFVSGLDYTYYPDARDLAASPIRDLIGQTAQVTFSYEQDLVPNVDYVAEAHIENLEERIENRLRTTNSLYTENSPVTNVFRIFNETTGEIYGMTRFNQNIVYFNFNQAPNIVDAIRERANFANVLNETIIVTQTLINSSSIRVFQINLLNNRIVGVTEDVIGSSYNTSVTFSQSIFEQEVYFDGQTLTVAQNIDRLSVGQYQIDYRNGIVYIAVSATQNFDLGTVSYKKPVIAPIHPHVIAVSNVYYSIDPTKDPTKNLNYNSFEEGAVFPTTLDVSDERFLNGDPSLQYQIINNTITVTDDIKQVRHVFDLYDLNNNSTPTDFGPTATSSANIITLDTAGIEKQETTVVGPGLVITVAFISPGIQIGDVLSVIRVSDGVELLDGYQTIFGNTITLSGSSGAVAGNVVNIVYTVVLNGAATPVVDYDRGGYYFDYTYLADEIIVSYEYGDNVLDFSQGDILNPGDEYFVTYRYGALRDSLLANFGSLIDIPAVQVFDIELPRENYRDLLLGGLQSFLKGPTIPAMELLVSHVSKITPQIIEAVFDIWSLGISYLFRDEIEIPGNPELVSGKFDQGILVDEPGQSVIFPVSSNLRLEEGTLEMWVKPEWDGLDNDATLTFSNLTRNGVPIDGYQIYIGASSFNPELDHGVFSINRTDDPSPVGLPFAVYTQIGMFIYYDIDVKRWKILVKDRPTNTLDGYVYDGTIVSSGEVYDVKFIENLNEPGDILRSGINKIDFSLNLNIYDTDGYSDGYNIYNSDGYSTTDGYVPGYSFDGFTFMADDEHYLFDFAEAENKNRFSLYKDGSGYLNFVIWDKGARFPQKPTSKNRFAVSVDIQDWEAGEQHQVAVSWKLNTIDHRDEMHLFIDGFEVYNILRYGGRPIATSSDRFRTVKPELVAGTIPKRIIVGNDLSTTQGSATVISLSNDFSSAGILPGDSIEIEEDGFATYTILAVTGNGLLLSAVMPATLADARFSVNPYSVVVTSEIDTSSNFAVFLLRGSQEIELPGLRAALPGYEISKNLLNQNVLTILGNALPGDMILIRTFGLNHRRARSRIYLWGNDQAVLRSQLPPPINLDGVSIRSALMPLVPIGPSNSTLILGQFVATGLPITQPSNSTEGRKLEVRITGGNVNFTTPTTVTINGTTAAGPLFETLVFTTFGTQTTINKFKTTSSVDVTTTPIITTTNGTAVEIKEAYSVTYPDGNTLYPVIRFAFKTQLGTHLQGDGSDLVTDPNGFFPSSDVGSLLVISSPALVIGTYTIIERIDNVTVRVTPNPAAAFTNGNYEIFNVSIGRSGFQNGFFFLQQAGSTNLAYPLPEGFYDFDYSAYLEVPFDPISQIAHIGSDFNNQKPAKAVIDEFRILNIMLTDTRVGETLATNEDSITLDFNAIRPFRKNVSTLMLIHFDELPLVNDSNFYTFANRNYIQSGSSVNSNFGHSILFSERGLVFDNKGRLTTNKEGSIEFWVSPRYDTYNDPVQRFYFDAASSVQEDVISITRGTVKVSGRINNVISVRLQTDLYNTGTDYFGSIDDDRQTINLNQALPYQQTPVKVIYIPSGFSGDRLSIVKDTSGFIAFNVTAQGNDYQVRTPVLWPRDTWHRIMATFKFNRQDNKDEIRLFVDGEERGVVVFGSGLLFGDGTVFGQTTVGVTNQILITDINFLDQINQFFIGSDYLGVHTAQARMDNIRLSNTARLPVTVAGQPLDVNFNSNLDIVFPVIEDVFTTFLLDFEKLIQKIDDFAILRDAEFGIFNFTINIIDSFGIVSGNDRIRDVLESMILALKPATAKVEINVIK